ncbi:MAG: pimeloyl-ACP methyl ester carboxylesterase [Myxococcota bacterium]|jgi:pimeloyl-ACP methyl ester carboxylesterase
MWFEDRLIYFPDPWPADLDVEATAGRPVVELTIESEGARLHGLQFPNPNAQQTLLFLHGNAGNLASRIPWLARLADLAEVVAIDYRGYGKSTGRPDEQGLIADAVATWDHLVAATPGRAIVVYGHSLGGAVAAQLCARRPCSGLILSSTFTSLPDMAARQMPLVPRALVRTQWDSLAQMPGLTMPKLILHSRGDQLIPYEMAERNFAAAAQPKRLLLLDAADHNEVVLQHGRAILEAVRQVLTE